VALLLLAGFRVLSPAQAAALPPALLTQIPTPLHPWLDWALRDLPQWRCPVYYDQTTRRQCIWPSALELRLDHQGGEWTQRAHHDAEAWLILPGDRRYWPQEVQLNDQPVPVLEQDGRPTLKAPPGGHVVTGRFFWSALPESIRIPPGNALLNLSIDGRPSSVFRLEKDGVLWLRQRPAAPAQQDALDVQVMGRGHAWLDTGTHDSLADATQFVQVIQQRQGLKIACPEEIAWRAGWIDDAQLQHLAQPLAKSGYGQYLLRLLEDRVF